MENAGAYTNAVETQVGGLLLADEGKTDADDATKASRGREAMQEWLGENNADVNPRYGIGIANGTFTDRRQRHLLPPQRQRRGRRQEPTRPGVRRDAAEQPTLRLTMSDPLAAFREDMRRLRAECVWKREQTHESLRRYLVEESWETLEAIDSGDPEHLREELGDLLLQIGFHAVIAEEAGEFTFDEVVQGIVDKLRRRNPHVFGDAPVTDAASVNELLGVGQGRRRRPAPRSSTACHPACRPCCSPTRSSTGPSGPARR